MTGKRGPKQNLSFINQLIRSCLELKKMKPNGVYIFNVMANHGTYQIKVGPEYSDEECKKLNLEPHSRGLEINGNVHNLFVSPKRISPSPHHEDIKSNLKGSVIMKDVAVHIVDRDGGGSTVVIEKIDQNGVCARRQINLAGEKGDVMVDEISSSGRLTNETYKIIQEDILDVLKVNK